MINVLLNIFICRPKAKISTGFVAGTSVLSPVHVCTTHGLHQRRRKSPNTANQYNQWHQKVCQGNQKEDQVNQKVGQGYQKGGQRYKKVDQGNEKVDQGYQKVGQGYVI